MLTLVFVDEVWAVSAYGVWGWGVSPRWLLVWLLPLAATLVWWAFASPKAAHGWRGVRPVVKVLVFGLAVLLLHLAGHPEWAWALLAFSLVVNALAELPGVRAVLSDDARTARGGARPA